MSKPIIKIINVETGEELEREMSDSEFEIFQSDELARIETENLLSAKAKQKTELLERLGITEEEARLLLG